MLNLRLDLKIQSTVYDVFVENVNHSTSAYKIFLMLDYSLLDQDSKVIQLKIQQ